MPANLGAESLAAISFGRELISEVYQGDELLWSAEKIYVFDTPGSYSLELPYARDLYLDVVVVGAGGGGGYNSRTTNLFWGEGGKKGLWTSGVWEVRNGEVVIDVGAGGKGGSNSGNSEGGAGGESRVALGVLSASASGGAGGESSKRNYDEDPLLDQGEEIPDPVMPFIGEELSFSPHGNGGYGVPSATVGDGSPGHPGYVWIRLRPR